ncbi:hypothetical protein COT50_02270 [candidate division WWE3 bacterium CG08_land_8_20_14_0_20_41_10]|uniref:Transposase IS4-like domain-containing protein n=2 Tax=Bacteria candidate phyla TaxID=1783234 RepID=A0A2H0XBU5_UNCKA|nr:MAG: hypothetical protein COX35_02290 [Candidatus Nealsonbacteria bacterium CG23_combo_of_CG06-09_8_20_14_all_37_18]PIS22404.1 MAG: hypothetical protein COT50_02270 [candidate division WWE3 bacterium CG08_land_8_20_14_0_20_41_10]
MWKTRTTKTSSGKTAVQIVERSNHKTRIIKHVGSVETTDKDRLAKLLDVADRYIIQKDICAPIFPEIIYGTKYLDTKKRSFVSVDDLEFNSFYHLFAHEFLSSFYDRNGFESLNNKLLKDLAIMRIIEPASKLRSVELINRYFGFGYTKNTVYKNLRKLVKLKLQAEEIAINYAKKYLAFDFSIVFYDVTTLYFETFENDADVGEVKGLRKCGFSKDGKSNQPQVLIALVVNSDGYPIASNVFEGNTYEGHTILPAVLALKSRYNIGNLTVIADAGMLNAKNMGELVANGLNYIVGARLGNIKPELLESISNELNAQPDIYVKKETPLGYLICDYSIKRASKDKSDRDKQIIRANSKIANPATITRKPRFVKEVTPSEYIVDLELVEKDKLLDGIKGYYTNLKDVNESLIVKRYKDLWKVEKAFRIAKADLCARPIFHRKRESIEAHVLIVFVSLCVTKSIELFTKYSIQKIRDLIWDVLDVSCTDTLTKQSFTKRTNNVPEEISEVKNSVKNPSQNP